MYLFLSVISILFIMSIMIIFSIISLVERVRESNKKRTREKEELIEKINWLTLEINAIKRNTLHFSDRTTNQATLKFLDCVSELNEIAEEIKKR